MEALGAVNICITEFVLRPVYTGDICCDFAAILSAIFSFKGCEEVNQL